MDIKINSGFLKGRKLMVFDKGSIRPTLSRARRVIFDTLQNIIPDSLVLDCFCGTGALGLESLSLGSKKVYFMDISKEACQNIKKTLRDWNINEGYEVFTANCFTPPQGQPVDILFLDPPYELYYLINKFVRRLLEADWISSNTILVVETFFKNKFTLPEGFSLWKQKRVSDSALFFYKFENE